MGSGRWGGKEGGGKGGERGGSGRMGGGRESITLEAHCQNNEVAQSRH